MKEINLLSILITSVTIKNVHFKKYVDKQTLASCFVFPSLEQTFWYERPGKQHKVFKRRVICLNECRFCCFVCFGSPSMWRNRSRCRSACFEKITSTGKEHRNRFSVNRRLFPSLVFGKSSKLVELSVSLRGRLVEPWGYKEQDFKYRIFHHISHSFLRKLACPAT